MLQNFLKTNADTIKLLRIPFSFFLMPIFFFAISQAHPIDWTKAILVFFVLHLFIFPASNGYNSFMDQDEGSIGGIEKPPKATKSLFYASIIFDLIGLILALIVGKVFFFCVLLFMLVSRAYSFKGIRLKKYAVIGFLTVVVFQGTFIYFMVYKAVSTDFIVNDLTLGLVLVACSFLMGGVYPLTQIYQHEADAASGDFTISYRLGIIGTFIFSSIMFAVAAVLLFFYFNKTGKSMHFILFQIFLLPVIFYFISWFLKTLKDKSQANFRNTMRMNFIASACMNLCFIVLLILNNK